MKVKILAAMFCAGLICLAGAMWFRDLHPAPTRASYSQFMDQLQAGQVVNVVVASTRSRTALANYRMNNGTEPQVTLPADLREASARPSGSTRGRVEPHARRVCSPSFEIRTQPKCFPSSRQVSRLSLGRGCRPA